MMKKIINITLIISLLMVMIIPLEKPKALTLGDYKNKVKELENKRYENDRLTQEKINDINAKRNAILTSNKTIEQNEQKVEAAKTQVAESKEQIKIKTEELKDVINILQYSDINSDEIYLDYIFDSSSISELMERQAVIEQIVSYTQTQLDDLEKLIDYNENLQVKLANDNIALNNSISTYEKQVEELEAYINSLATIGLDYENQIKAQQGLIKIYQDAGCKDDEDLDVCYYSKMGSSSSFSRPLDKGVITQAWNASHGGIDIAGNNPGTNVYSPANGTVVFTLSKYKCGGNLIYVHYNVGGKKYTTEFGHLRSIKVKAGQYIAKGQVIGTVGGDSSTWYYDSCTTGAHLHYAIAYGYFFTERGWGSEFYTYKSYTRATSVQSISGLVSQKGWRFTTRG